MDSQHGELSATLVMRRFFEALRTENLMAVELWANHPEFDGGSVKYDRIFDKLVGEGKLSLNTIEWLLNHTRHTHDSFFRRNEERKKHNVTTWRGHVCSWGRGWVNDFDTMSEQQRRCVIVLHELGWMLPSMDLLKHPNRWPFLQEVASPARVLEMALTKPSEYVKNKYVQHPFCMPLVKLLLAQGNLDLSKCGDELLREYKSDEGRALALKLIRARDTNIPMPKEFTDFMQHVVEQYKWYLRVAQDLPTLLESKTLDP